MVIGDRFLYEVQYEPDWTLCRTRRITDPDVIAAAASHQILDEEYRRAPEPPPLAAGGAGQLSPWRRRLWWPSHWPSGPSTSRTSVMRGRHVCQLITAGYLSASHRELDDG